MHRQVGKRIPRRQDPGGMYGGPNVYCATETERSKAQPLLVFSLRQRWGFLGRSDSRFLEHLNHCTQLNFCVLAFLYINEDNQKLPPYDKIGEEVLGEGLEG